MQCGNKKEWEPYGLWNSTRNSELRLTVFVAVPRLDIARVCRLYGLIPIPQSI